MPAMNRRRLVLGTIFAMAAWLAFWGDKTPQPVVVEPVARSGAPAKRVVQNRAPAEATPQILAIVAREALIGGARRDAPQA